MTIVPRRFPSLNNLLARLFRDEVAVQNTGYPDSPAAQDLQLKYCGRFVSCK